MQFPLTPSLPPPSRLLPVFVLLRPQCYYILRPQRVAIVTHTVHTCSAAEYQVPHTPLSNCTIVAIERSEHNKWKPAGGKDDGYEILAFYLARQLQSRANGWLGKKLFRKDWRLS